MPDPTLADQLSGFREEQETLDSGVIPEPQETEEVEPTPASPDPDPVADDSEVTPEPTPAVEPEVEAGAAETQPETPAEQLIEVDGQQIPLSEYLEKAKTWQYQASHTQELLRKEREERTAAEAAAAAPEPSPKFTDDQIRGQMKTLVGNAKPLVERAIATGQISKEMADDYPDDTALILLQQQNTQRAGQVLHDRLKKIEDAISRNQQVSASEALEGDFARAVDQVQEHFGEAYAGLSDDDHVIELATWAATDPVAKQLGQHITQPVVLRSLYDMFVQATGVKPPVSVARMDKVRDAALAGGGAGATGGAGGGRRPPKDVFAQFREAVAAEDLL